jgi:hypothetical protein
MGTTPVGRKNSKQTPPRAKVMWELPPLPLSPITRPPLWEHLPSQMGHPVENLPPMTTMDMLMDSLRQTRPLLLEIRAVNAILPEDPLFMYPITKAHGKSTVKSLMHPQDVARRLLPCDLFLQLQQFCYNGCPAHCSPDWTPEVIKAAMAVGPHVSALVPENAQLIWEDIEYQVKVEFVRMISVSNFFGENQPPDLKISRVAVVPRTTTAATSSSIFPWRSLTPSTPATRRPPGPSAAPTPSPRRPQNQPITTAPPIIGQQHDRTCRTRPIRH